MKPRLIALLLLGVGLGAPIASEAQFEVIPTNVPSEPYGEVAVILEANTYAPGTYQGRSEPTAGSVGRLIAIVSGVSETDPGNLRYIWDINGKTTEGSDVLETVFPENQLRVSLTVLDGSNQLVANYNNLFTIYDPELVFYELNPLRGLSKVAIKDELVLVAEEITVRAVPFFVDRGSLNTSVLYEWKVNNHEVENPSANPLEIVLQRTDDEQLGRSTVSLSLYNINGLFGEAEQSFVLDSGL